MSDGDAENSEATSHRGVEDDKTSKKALATSSQDISANGSNGENGMRQGEDPSSSSQHTSDEISDEDEVFIVHRRSRRGLIATFAIIPEVTDPRKYGRRTKWTITMIVALAAAAAPLGSTIVLPALSTISDDFSVDASVTNLSVALYMLSMSIFPLWWSSFSESLGRRTIFIFSFALFTFWVILCAISQSIGMFIVMRLLSGGASASVQAVGAGVIADLWIPKERGRAMGFFFLGPLCGPMFGPIIGGALTQDLGWRATQWFLVVYGGLMAAALVFCLPETLPVRKAEDSDTSITTDSQNGEMPALSRVSTKRSIQQQTQKGAALLRQWFIDPLSIILYMRFPAVAVTVLYASITFGSLYFLNVSIQYTFSRPPYDFSVVIVGLLYIPNSIGYILASIFGGRWTDWIMAREAKKANRYDDCGKLIYAPEDRMRENAWSAAILYPGALIWYGWTAEKNIFWLVPVGYIYPCRTVQFLANV